MDKMEAYFDNSATTRVFDCVKDAVVNAMTAENRGLYRAGGRL